jgi:hypothetical protein
VDIAGLAKGSVLWLEDGSVVEVVKPSADGRTVRVRYVESPFDESQVGTEVDCTDYEIVSFAGPGDNADSASAR